MGLFDQIGSVLDQYSSGSDVSREQAHRDYDRIAGAVPKDVLASAIGPAVSSLGAGEVQQRVRNSANEMTPALRGQFLGTLLNAVSGSGGNASSILSTLGLSPSIAQQ